jgi:hypothetical protein
MDLSQEEKKSKKIVLAALIFLLVLALGIIGARFYFQNKAEKNQRQTESGQEPKNTIVPVLPSVTEPSKSPDIIPPSDKEEIPVPPDVTEPSKPFDKIPSSNDEKIPPPLP